MFADIQVFTTCPQSKDHPQDQYVQRVIQVSQWSDDVGCTGMLIYADNSIIDPWMVAQIVIAETRQLAPLVAVQPIYMHPYMVAKKVASLYHLYRRPVWLNMIAGGFRNDLLALGDATDHDLRYARLVEYTEIIQGLLADRVTTYDGEHYRVKALRLVPPVPVPIHILMSGSSDASRRAAIMLGAIAIEYPEQNPPSYSPVPQARGVRVGIIANSTSERAWEMAYERFPEDRRGQVQHAMARRLSDSSWQKQLGAAAETVTDGPYWLWPFKNYATFCPYLVGDYDTVAAEIARYINLGYKTFILDIPRKASDLLVAREVFRRATGGT